MGFLIFTKGNNFPDFVLDEVRKYSTQQLIFHKAWFMHLMGSEAEIKKDRAASLGDVYTHLK